MNLFEKYELIYPRLIITLNWRFDYVFFERKKQKMERVLEKLCENLVDVVHETFTKKYCIVRIPESKRGHIYLIVRSERGRLLYKEKEAFHWKIFNIVSNVFT